MISTKVYTDKELEELKYGKVNDIIDTNENGKVKEVQYIGKLDKNKLGKYKDKIITDEVVLTNERKKHTEKRHPGVCNKYIKYIPDILYNPDYIAEDKDYENTILILKNIIESDKNIQIVIKLSNNENEKDKCNSILTFWSIRKRSYKSTLNNNEIIYNKFDKNE